MAITPPSHIVKAMISRSLQTSIFSLCWVLSASAAFACSPTRPDYKSLPLSDQVKQNIRQADAIVDGEIVRVSGYDYKNKREIQALLKVRKIIKGPSVRVFSLRLPAGGCEIFFRRKEKVRLLLSETGGSWAARETLNLPSPALSEAPGDRLIDNRLPYAKLIDKQIGIPRSADTAVVPWGF
ncbi:hypothetical protein [Sphingobium sp. B11D3A]|uniref:hypothetical protein n=1 Tax=Sphingobium sp. B11D3A TaxID=2940574 RepID=UPI00222543D8|nr:hypothetical protein [Sphingobium sp. B11D3A]MCW2392267.1 hypothetical protein [Sphingobium sp. B11D3A]